MRTQAFGLAEQGLADVCFLRTAALDHKSSPDLAPLFGVFAFMGSLCFPLTRQKGSHFLLGS